MGEPFEQPQLARRRLVQTDLDRDARCTAGPLMIDLRISHAFAHDLLARVVFTATVKLSGWAETPQKAAIDNNPPTDDQLKQDRAALNALKRVMDNGIGVARLGGFPNLGTALPAR